MQTFPLHLNPKSPSTPSAKPLPKSKVASIYESFFHGNDPSKGNPNFWLELFLLKVDHHVIAQSISKLSQDELFKRKSIFNLLLTKCIEYMRNDNSTRRYNATKTLAVIFSSVFAKKFHNFNSDVINLFMGLDSADEIFKGLISAIELNLSDEPNVRLASTALTSVLSIGNENININSLNEYFFTDNMLRALIQALMNQYPADATPDQLSTGIKLSALMAMFILANYNKTESRNSFMRQLGQINDPSIFEEMTLSLSSQLQKCRDFYVPEGVRNFTFDDESPVTLGSVLSGITGMFSWSGATQTSTYGNIPMEEWEETLSHLPPPPIVFLLPLYDLMYSNSHYVGFLSSRPDNELIPNFLSLCSYTFQNTHAKNPRSFIYAKLCLIILLILSENQTFCNVASDPDRSKNIRLCRLKKPTLPKPPSTRPIACFMLDVALEFILHNMRKKLQTDLLIYAASIINRLILNLRTTKTKLPYSWSFLYHSLIQLLNFIVSNKETLRDVPNIDALLESVLTIFNSSILHGDSFLPDASSYDLLYYDVLRSSQLFYAVNELLPTLNSSRPSYSPSSSQSSLPQPPPYLRNIINILDHFLPLITKEQELTKSLSLTSDQIIRVLKANYDGVELIVDKGLEDSMNAAGGVGSARYNENPNEVGFVRLVVRTVVGDWKGWIFKQWSGE